MIVVMKQGATRAQVVNVTARIEQLGCTVHLSEGEERTIYTYHYGHHAIWGATAKILKQFADLVRDTS